MNLLRCPHCNSGIRLSEVGEEFSCRNCGQRLKSSLSVFKVNFIALTLGGIPWLAVELLVFDFKYPLIDFSIFMLSSFLAGVLCIRLGRIEKITGG